ncbi:hypothetical protein NDU88_008164 [Pleurodeles waltl]|uniref:Uncharacterized protein n=1 Tax=Pleurodeles waltl TaxID=8319 RepID=A0AAV7RW37_PLEWA|nr:hypothetical protein NDU88_008164 [Pleurodeles waltl]
MLTWALAVHSRQLQRDLDTRDGKQEHVTMAPGAKRVQCMGMGGRESEQIRIHTGTGGRGQTGVWRHRYLRCREGKEEQGYTEVEAERADGAKGQAQQQREQT